MTAAPPVSISTIIRELDGVVVPGGCDGCDAYQIIEADFWGRDLHRVSTHHDNDCPWLAALEDGGRG